MLCICMAERIQTTQSFEFVGHTIKCTTIKFLGGRHPIFQSLGLICGYIPITDYLKPNARPTKHRLWVTSPILRVISTTLCTKPKTKPPTNTHRISDLLYFPAPCLPISYYFLSLTHTLRLSAWFMETRGWR